MTSPQLTQVTTFSVIGGTVRTANRDEMNPATAKIGALWTRFLGEEMTQAALPIDPNAAIFGVYSHYESDASGFYNLTVGRSVVTPPIPALPATHTFIQIEGGSYLVFKAANALPMSVFTAWTEVWNYFEQNQHVKRKFSTDFEKYKDNQAAIYIAIE